MRDFKRLRQDPPQGVNGSPNPDNIMLWNAVIFGPEDTPWDGGKLARAAGFAAVLNWWCRGATDEGQQERAMHVDTLHARVVVCPGTFKLTLEFTEDYPNKAPIVKFKSTMFHPNSK